MNKKNKDPLSQRIKELRMQKGWTQQELAQKAKLAKPLISMLETGERHPSEEVLKKLCEAFDINEEDILSEEVKQKAIEEIQKAETRDILTAYRKIYRE